MNTDSQPAYLQDGLADDYERWHDELSEGFHEDKAPLYVPDLQSFQAKQVSRPVQEAPDGSRFHQKSQGCDANVGGMENVKYYWPPM